MCDPDHGQAGRRVFSVKIQGKPVLADFDLAREAGGRDRAVVKEFSHIPVQDKLTIELVPKAGNREPDQTPILQGLEIVCQQVTSLGCAAPDFLLNGLEPTQRGELRLANLRSEAFDGLVRLTAPDGFDVQPAEVQASLTPGARSVIPVVAKVADGVPAGTYPLTVKMLRGDGTVALERTATIEHLGRRGRAVLHPIEDASVHHRYPTLNKGKAATLLIDGGHQAMNDEHHVVALLKFRLDISGRPVSARLRIHNAGNPSGDSGRICLVTGPWREETVTYSTRPDLGTELGRLGRVQEHQTVELSLPTDLGSSSEISLAIDPTSCDGVDYLSRESPQPPELIVEYELKPGAD
jgi:hypothetical protein